MPLAMLLYPTLRPATDKSDLARMPSAPPAIPYPALVPPLHAPISPQFPGLILYQFSLAQRSIIIHIIKWT